jgi:sugar phosphate isomerase/epimerase
MKLLFLSACLAFFLCAIGIGSARAAEPQRIGGLRVAGHAWTWGKGTVFEAIDHCHEVGVDSIEVFLMGQTLSKETGDVLFGEAMPDDALAALQAKCTTSGVRIINAYIGKMQWTRIGQDEAALRKFFEFGKKLGVTGYTGEPAEAQWDMVERMVKEYGVTFSIHNHWNGFAAENIAGPYPYWDPRATAAKLNAQKRDPRFGICFDTGHAARSGLDVLAVLKAIAGRCISVHLKDVSAANLEAHDVPYGHGIVDVPAFLAELRRQEIRGHVGLEYEWSDSPTFAADVKTLVEFIRNTPAAFPPPKTLGDVSGYGRNIQRTMRLLATSTPEHRNTVRVLFYGQSITEQGWWKIVADDLRKRFPNANLIIENRALGGFSSQLLVKTAETDLYSFQPDLLIFYVYGAHDKYEDIIRRTRERTCAEILQQDDHVTKPEQLTEEMDPAKVPIQSGHWDQFMNFNWLPSLSRKYGTEFCDQRALWKRYLTDYQLAPKDLLKDGVHLNPHGEYVMAEFVKAYLRDDPKLGPTPADDWVKTVNATWHEGLLHLEFEGNRIDAICAPGGVPADVRIDGRKPSEFPELYGFTRALATPGSKWPPIAPIGSGKPLLLEDWTMQVQVDPANDKAYIFSLAGTKTGPDGEGRSDQRFVSNSGRIVIESGDWNVPFALGVLGGQKPVAAQFTVKWSVVPRFVDTLGSPAKLDPTVETTVVLAQGLANTKHTLDLSIGSGQAPITGLRIYRPPLDRH